MATKNGVLVRRPRGDEWQAWRDLRLESLREHPDAFLESFAAAAALDDNVWMQRVLHGHTLVAVRNGRITGMCVGYMDDTGAPRLVAMYVMPAGRGSGLVEALVEAVVAWAADVTDSAAVILWVNASNHRARDAYKRSKFVETGRVEPHPSLEGATVVEMARALRTV